MKKIIILLIIALLATSCQLNPLKKEQVITADYHSGNKGITLEYLDNAPPNEVYEENPFDIILKVHNQGANAVMAGMLIISVEEQNLEIKGERDQRFDLVGKSEFNPDGAFELITFKAKSKKLGLAIAKQYTTTITTTACYPYKTSATSMMCIDTDLLGQVPNKPCTPTREGYGAGQGAPVSVVSVTPKMMPHEDEDYITPEFTIIISNPGGGDVVLTEKVYDACTGKTIGRDDWNRIKMSASLSDQPLECLPKEVKLKPGENKIICTLTQGIEKTKGTYVAPVSIDLEYGYMSRKIKTMDIIKPEVS